MAFLGMTYFSGLIMHMNVKMSASQGIHIKKYARLMSLVAH